MGPEVDSMEEQQFVEINLTVFLLDLYFVLFF